MALRVGCLMVLGAWLSVLACAGLDASPMDDAGPEEVDGGAAVDGGADAGEAADASASPDVLLVGHFATAAVAMEAPAVYHLAVEAGDVLRLSVFTVRGDLRPAAYLSLAGAAIEPDAYEVDDRQVVLDYLLTQGGDYRVEVRPHQGMGVGTFLLRTECTGGPCAARVPPDVPLRVLALNDLHGYLEPPSASTGGAAWLAAHVRALEAEVEHHLFVSAGDLVGGSPFLSARFHDEPTIEAANLMGLDIAAVGNHEFDEGPEELLRLVEGGCHPVDGCQDGTPFEGAEFEVLAANVQTTAGMALLPSVAVRVFGGLPVGVIGMTLEGTPWTTVASQVEDLVFEDEVATVNALVPELQAMGVEAIVVVVHQGGVQQGGANECTNFSGAIRGIASMVDDGVDAVISGHTHATYNCVISGKAVTSAGSAGRWLSTLDFTLGGASRDATLLEARNRAVDHGLDPDPAVAALVARYRALVDDEQDLVVGTLAEALTRRTDDADQSTLGLAIADSQLYATQASSGAQIAFMNRAGMRADLPAGPITYGQAFEAQPFGNALITLTLTGQQLQDLLDDQFAFGNFTVLQPSASLRYRIQPVAPGSSFVRVVPGSVTVLGLPLDLAAEYRVTANRYIADGGDGHSTFTLGTERVEGGNDVDAFVDYLSASESPFPAPALDRITFQ